ncbi:DEAD/DEAH box helicase [Candidatus Woesearchaeota archaeon]|nr:DEAD/DEAH box helicase [Candidatus Woesearchaeota archaeon]
MKFEEFNLSPQLMDAIDEIGIKEPTQIQELSIPHIISGKDVIGESATGSGKTLAFGCGVIDNIVPGKGLQALILAPTRELAEQIKVMLKQLSYKKQIRITSIYGGVSITPQIRDLSRADVAVATPGRLLDHIQRKTINTSRISLLVLDEVDCMFDMGFIDDVERIIRSCPPKKQLLCFSATISQNIKRLANRHMREPIEVSAKKHVDPAKLKQAYYDVPRALKLSLLVHLLSQKSEGLSMIFCNTRHTVDFISKNLHANKIRSVSIHGGLSQNKRTNTMEIFNRGEVNVLVCTEVAARGLHIENVAHIYNYDIPKDAKDYVHRIGRTARAGEEGEVINILSEQDYDNFRRIKSEYREFSILKLEKPYIQRVNAIMEQPFRRQSFQRNSFHRYNRY